MAATSLLQFCAAIADRDSLDVDTDVDGLANGWSSYVFGTGAPTYSLDAVTFLDGIKSQKMVVVTNDGSRGIRRQVSVTAGVQYRVSIWVRSTVATQYSLYVEVAGNPETLLNVAANTWTELAVVFTAPATATINIYARTGQANVTAYFDLFTFVEMRLDLNDGTTWDLLRGARFDPPPLNRSVVGSPLREGEDIPASWYGNREIVLPLRVEAASRDLLATELQKLDRELNRPRNFLRWQQRGSSRSVFFRTFRSPNYEIVAEGDQFIANITLKIMAEPFAYGVREDITPVVVANDPATGCVLDLTAAQVLGEVDTPLLIQIDEPASSDRGLYWASIRKHGTPSDLVWFVQAEAANSLVNDTTSQAVAGNSGGSVARTTFATVPGAAERIAWTSTNFPLSGPTLAQARALRGQYRLVARIAHSVSGDVIKVRARYGGGGGEIVTTDWQTLPSDTTAKLIDFGKVQFPFGLDQEGPGYSGVLGGAGPFVQMRLDAERVSGTGNMEVDVFALLPADEGLIKAYFPSMPTADMFIDGPNEAAYIAADDWMSGGILNASKTQVDGGFLSARPNQANRLYIIQMRQDASIIRRWTITSTSETFAVFYWPRWLNIRP